MNVSHSLSLDLLRQGSTAVVDAVQGDKYSRKLVIALHAGGEAWKPPEGTVIVIRYLKSDGRGGEYDTLPDESAAWSLEADLLTVTLAPQILAVPGLVQLEITMIHGDTELTTFRLLVHVHPSVGAQLTASEDYRYVTGYIPMPEDAMEGHFIQVLEVNEKGVITATQTMELEDCLSNYDFLPEVTQEDAGKVLRVSPEGQWGPEFLTVFQPISQQEYDALASAGEIQEDVLYMIVGDAP